MATKAYNSLHYIHQYDFNDIDVSKMFGFVSVLLETFFVNIKQSLQSFMMAYKMFQTKAHIQLYP